MRFFLFVLVAVSLLAPSTYGGDKVPLSDVMAFSQALLTPKVSRAFQALKKCGDTVVGFSSRTKRDKTVITVAIGKKEPLATTSVLEITAQGNPPEYSVRVLGEGNFTHMVRLEKDLSEEERRNVLKELNLLGLIVAEGEGRLLPVAGAKRAIKFGRDVKGVDSIHKIEAEIETAAGEPEAAEATAPGMPQVERSPAQQAAKKQLEELVANWPRKVQKKVQIGFGGSATKPNIQVRIEGTLADRYQFPSTFDQIPVEIRATGKAAAQIDPTDLEN